MKINQLDDLQFIQEKEYNFPYHYIPSLSGGRFSQTKYWSWGFRYLGGIKIVIDQLNKLEFESIIDIGCGDGRFLRDFHEKFPSKRCKGIDYSDQAIQLVKAMNPYLNYQCIDIVNNRFEEKYDVATAMEVLEHIPPNELGEFIKSIVSILNTNGVLILTVPSNNLPVQDKHYQHFSKVKLENLLSLYFQRREYFFIDPFSRIIDILYSLIGSNGDRFIVTHSKVLNYFFSIYTKKYLYTENKNLCMRLCVVCTL